MNDVWKWIQEVNQNILSMKTIPNRSFFRARPTPTVSWSGILYTMHEDYLQKFMDSEATIFIAGDATRTDFFHDAMKIYHLRSLSGEIVKNFYPRPFYDFCFNFTTASICATKYSWLHRDASIRVHVIDWLSALTIFSLRLVSVGKVWGFRENYTSTKSDEGTIQIPHVSWFT